MSLRDIIKLILILALIIVSITVFNRVGSVHDREEASIVRDAVRQAAITCYAVEGAYPDDVEYLREHYQLAYDQDRYAVTLEGFASNLIPDIYIEDRYSSNSNGLPEAPEDDEFADDFEIEQEE